MRVRINTCGAPHLTVLFDAEQYFRAAPRRKVLSPYAYGSWRAWQAVTLDGSERSRERIGAVTRIWSPVSQKQRSMPIQSNRFLNSVSTKSRKELLSHATLVSFNLRDVISEVGGLPRNAYFPLTGVASEVVTLADGETVEIGLVGFEGVTGVFHLLGTSKSLSQTFVQVSGEAYRLPFRHLKEVFGSSPDVHKAVLQYVQHQMTHLGQTAACNRVHDAGPRFARWLLTVQDRSSVDEFALTHQFLAHMLGTGRPTVSLIAKLFEKKKLIGQNRGRIRIVDRPGLEALACPCYEATRGTLVELYG